MAKQRINYRRLRECMEWVEAYAEGRATSYKALGELFDVAPGPARHVIDLAREAGLLVGGHGSGQEAPRIDAEARARILQGEAPRPAEAPQEAQRKPLARGEAFTAEEIEELKAMVVERRRRRIGEGLRSGQAAGPTSIRPDSGLWEALKAWADKNGYSNVEALNKAIEQLVST